jgi:uncharacterized membrane protein (UPF0127 family)
VSTLLDTIDPMERRPRRRRLVPLAAVASALVAVAAVVACGGDDLVAPIRTATPAGSTASVFPTPTGEATATTPSATPTPRVVATASTDEPIASTATIPDELLARAVFTTQAGETYELRIEVPPREEYSIGLSGRLELGERGMLFWYPEVVQQSFWMKDTHYDLSIAFVDGDARIVAILDLERESLETRRPEAGYRYAIEAPAGWYAEHGIEVGDAAVLDFEIPAGLRD